MGAVPGPSRCRVCVTLLYFAASAVGLVALAWHSLRHGSRARRKLAGGTWLATHTEWSNRTRHVLKLAGDVRQPVPLILLGRPRETSGRFLSLLRKHVTEAEFAAVRPLSFTAFLKALPEIFRACGEVTKDARETGLRLPFRKAVAVLYRLQLGCVHRNWWRRSNYRPDIVIYGHTGKADTSLLEREQQEGGTRTVHLLHGFSNGVGFSGISDVVIARCLHDAEWHRRLGGYGQSVFLPAARPPLEAPRRRWALLTNYAHHMARPTVAAGVIREQETIRIVASVARRLGIAAREILYRPHPALSSLHPEHQSAVGTVATDSGLRRWPADLGLNDLGEFELVIVTPSTVIQDALLAGTVPVLLDLEGMDDSSVYADFPLRVRSEAELARVVREVQADRIGSFEQAWNAAGPGIVPSVQQILAIPVGDEARSVGE